MLLYFFCELQHVCVTRLEKVTRNRTIHWRRQSLWTMVGYRLILHLLRYICIYSLTHSLTHTLTLSHTNTHTHTYVHASTCTQAHRVIQKLKIPSFCRVSTEKPSCSQPRPHCQWVPFVFAIKETSGSQKFHKDEEVKNPIVTTWLCAQVAGFYDIKIQKLVPRPNKCCDKGGDYVEK